MIPDQIVLLGSFVGMTGCFAYVRDTLLGKTQPNRMTFLLWALAPFIATAAEITSDVTWAVVPVFMSGFSPFLIFCASFVNKKAYWKLGKFDWACGVLSVLALLLWYITRSASIAILFALLSDLAASLPTLKKCWTHPQTETGWLYLGGAFSASMGLLVAKSTSFSEIAFPIYLTLICLALIGAIQLGKWRNRRAATTAVG